MNKISLLSLKVVKEKEIEYGDALENNTLLSCEKIKDIATDILKIHEQPEESFYMITVNTKLKPTGIFEVSRGTLNTTIVTPREIFKRAVMQNAYAIFLLHNHPSGDPKPSKKDITLTKRLIKVGEIIGIRVIDHIIIGDEEKYISFKKEKCVNGL